MENVLLVEDKLWTLLEVARFLDHLFKDEKQEMSKVKVAAKMGEIAFICDEWWEITHQDNLNNFDKVFTKDEDLRRAVRKTLICMLLAVTLSYAISIEKGNPEE